MLNFDETRFLRIQFGAVGDVEAIENRTLSAKLWPVEGLLDHSFTRPVDAGRSQKGRYMVYKIAAEADRQYIEEFRNNPIAPHHSPGLQRLLNVMRMYRGGDQYILIARREFHDYVIGRMPPLRDDPIVIEDDVTFASREAAEWELFCRRWREQTGEIINELYEDKTA